MAGQSRHQAAQRQQILIETLSQQMESSSEQVAQLERECAHIQQRYNEQSFNLSISENTCTELRSRLERQQRYSLQLKAALDKCLEVPYQTELAAEIGNAPVGAQLQYNPQNASARLRLLLKPQPIQPWSASLDAIAEDIPSDQTNQTDSSEPAFNLPLTEETPEEISTPIEWLAQEEPEVTTEAIKDTAPVPVAPKPKLSDDLPDLSADVSGNINEAEEVLWEELERLTQAAIASIFGTIPIRFGENCCNLLIRALGKHMADIVDTAVNAGSFQTLVRAIQAAGLVDTLKSPGSFTVFAPTDEAFGKLPAGTIDSLLGDIPALKQILTYHVVSDRAIASDLIKLNSVTTLEGSKLKIDASEGNLKVGNAKVITPDLAADNGVIHAIDTVLLPE